jgi:copper chaperone
MKTMNFKTTMKCGNCVATATPFLNNLQGVENWNVDTTNPDKILTVTGDNVDEKAVTEAVEKAGFKAEPVK